MAQSGQANFEAGKQAVVVKYITRIDCDRSRQLPPEKGQPQALPVGKRV